MKPIRRDLGISDTQMSLLMGFSFAVFYTVFGIPLGWLADTRSRRGIIAAGVTVWSFFTAACGLARNFTQLLFLRMGVGVGEASLGPSAYSMISDYFPPQRRATALSVYGMGIYIGSGIAYLLGGVIVGLASAQDAWIAPVVGALRPWQIVFLAVGLPGILMGMLVLTVREPLRRGNAANAKAPAGATLAYMRANKWTLLCHGLGFGFISLRTNAGASWIPSFFTRTHGWTSTQIGVSMGLIVMIAGSLGVVGGGMYADRLAARGCHDSKLRVALYAVLCSLPTGVAMMLTASSTLAILLYIPTVFFTSAPFGVAPAAIQEMMPNSMRGQASAIYLFVNNLVGLGLGPTSVALISDYVFHDDKAVGQALLIVSVASSAVASLLLWFGMRHFLRTMNYLRSFTARQNLPSSSLSKD